MSWCRFLFASSVYVYGGVVLDLMNTRDRARIERSLGSRRGAYEVRDVVPVAAVNCNPTSVGRRTVVADGGWLIVDSVVGMGCSMVADSSCCEIERSLVVAALRKNVFGVHRLVKVRNAHCCCLVHTAVEVSGFEVQVGAAEIDMVEVVAVAVADADDTAVKPGS